MEALAILQTGMHKFVKQDWGLVASGQTNRYILLTICTTVTPNESR